ncbi:hypothetical protein CDV55_102601 [Aspergillus turcosus]|uniref:Aminotransferase class I/classII large domain-containing protein n=1 Tax=Aspergillus turcosus TaxID=1245748 RepID=A0A229YJB3_9EURO|nr:hypothetical protein CDV55_102601 [Aspergillus turcosus]RLL96974.1 hypothetical protein CFD26_105876 [Aspergillus turcosus]
MVRVFRDTTELVRSVGRVRQTIGLNFLHTKTDNMQTQFLGLSVASPDPTYKLMAAFHADSHPNKVSLITGAYRDQEGRHITNRLSSNIASLQTVSGTGANHLAAVFLSKHLQPKRVFIPDPSWVNHKTVWATAGPAVTQHEYPYYSPSTQSVNLEAMLPFLDTTAEPNDIIILQACAHNPTGTDLTKSQLIEVADLVKEKKLFPIFDSAYQGYATGDVDADAWAIRYFTEQMLSDADSPLPGVCVAQSFAKNFRLYGERVGALHLVVPRACPLKEPNPG